MIGLFRSRKSDVVSVEDAVLERFRKEKRVAAAVFYVWLVLSVLANFVSAATHYVDGSPNAVINGAVAVLWPLALFSAEALLTRISATIPKADIARWLVGGLIAFAGFLGSAGHLVDLADRTGAGSWTAYSAPVIVDGLLILGGVTLVVLSRLESEAKLAVIEAAQRRRDEEAAAVAAAEQQRRDEEAAAAAAAELVRAEAEAERVRANAAAELVRAEAAAKAEADERKQRDKRAKDLKKAAGDGKPSAAGVTSDDVLSARNQNPDLTNGQLAELLGVSESTILRRLREVSNGSNGVVTL